jgi:hypothetical protein
MDKLWAALLFWMINRKMWRFLNANHIKSEIFVLPFNCDLNYCLSVCVHFRVMTRSIANSTSYFIICLNGCSRILLCVPNRSNKIQTEFRFKMIRPLVVCIDKSIHLWFHEFFVAIQKICIKGRVCDPFRILMITSSILLSRIKIDEILKWPKN